MATGAELSISAWLNSRPLTRRNPENREVAGGHEVTGAATLRRTLCQHRFPGCRLRAESQGADGRNSPHARHRRDARGKVRVVGRDGARALPHLARRPAADLHDLLGPDAEVHPQRPGEAVEHESGRRKNHDDNRHLCDDQERATPAAPEQGVRPAAFLERRPEMRASQANRGKDRGRKTCEDRQGQREDQHASIHAGRQGHEESRGNAGAQRVEGARCQEQPQQSPRPRHEQTFDEQLTDQARASGAERSPNGQLALPPAPARQEQVGQVHDREEQDETGRRHEHRRQPADGREHRGLQRDHTHAGRLTRARCLKPPAHRVYFGLRLFDARAARQPRDRDGPGTPAGPRSGNEQVRLPHRQHGCGHEAGRCHPNDPERALLEDDGPSDDRRIPAEVLLPRGVGQDSSGVVSRGAFVWLEVAAENRPNSENGEQIRADLVGPEDLPFVVRPGERRSRPTGAGGRFEAAPIGDLDEDLGRDRGGQRAAPLVVAHDPDEAGRVPERKGPEEDGIDQGEDGGVGSDAERKRCDRHRSEARVPAKRACPVSDVLPHRLEPEGALVADRLLRLFHAAQVEPGPAARFLGRQALSHVVIDQHLDVSLEFLREPPVERAPADEIKQTAQQPPCAIHRHLRRGYFASRKRATIAVARSQLAASVARWRRPVFVSS